MPPRRLQRNVVSNVGVLVTKRMPTVSVMHVDVDVHDALKLLQQFHDAKHYVVDVAIARCFVTAMALRLEINTRSHTHAFASRVGGKFAGRNCIRSEYIR